MATTVDGLLNRRVALEQPELGYRVAIDTVLLAAAVPALTGDRVLDMGCGVGGAMLCLASRVPEITGIGVEILPDYVELCQTNIARNAFAKGLKAREGDVTQPMNGMRAAFDHIFANPPYHEEKRHDASPDSAKRSANLEKRGDLPLWINTAAEALKPSGTLTLIHRADREADILSTLAGAFGDIEIIPLLPKEGAAPKRVIIRARKGGALPPSRRGGLVLHKSDGGYTVETDAILRDGKALFKSA